LRFWTIAQSPPAYQFFVTITPLAVWCVAFALTAIDGDCLAEWTNVPIGPKAGVALVIGVAAFCLHAMIDMAFFYSATATAFFALVAVAIAVRCPGQASDDGGWQLSARRAMLRLAPALIAAAWLAHGWWAWWPAWTAERPLNEARRDALAEVANPLTGRAIANFRAAEHADPWEPAAPLEAAEWLFNHAAMPHSTETPDDVRGILDEAVRMAHLAVDRDRQAINGYRILTSIHMLRGERFGTILDARATVGAAKYLYRLYPESPQDRLTLAEALVGWAKAEPDTVLYDEAIAQFERALALDAARPGERELRRWSVEMRSQIERRLADVKAARASLAASQPASE
jgi:tetratricopeptide (TPR) repeat protein